MKPRELNGRRYSRVVELQGKKWALQDGWITRFNRGEQRFYLKTHNALHIEPFSEALKDGVVIRLSKLKKEGTLSETKGVWGFVPPTSPVPPASPAPVVTKSAKPIMNMADALEQEMKDMLRGRPRSSGKTAREKMRASFIASLRN